MQHFSRTAPFALRQERDADTITLVLRGELDVNQAHGLGTALAAAEVGQPRILQLDLADVTFIDAAGMRVLRDAGRRARRDERELLLIDPAPPVRRVFNLVGIDRVATITTQAGATATAGERAAT